MIVGNRSKLDSLTSVQTMSMEALLARTVAHSPDFDPTLALGRIHGILSALIQHCKTRAAYLYTGCFTCELQISSQGNAFVPPVVPDYEAKAELVRVWKLVRAVEAPGGALISQSLPPAVSEPHHLHLTKTAEPFTSPNVVQPLEPFAPLLSWTIFAPFALCCALNICYNVFWKILPIVTLIFQIFFFLYFAVFALMFSVTFCTMVLTSC